MSDAIQLPPGFKLVPQDGAPQLPPGFTLAPPQQPAPAPQASPAGDPGQWLEGDAKAAYAQWKAQQAAPQQPPQLGAGTGSAIATTGGLLEGIPVAGPAIRGGVNRAAAGLRSVMDGTSYGDELNTVNQATVQAKQDHPYLDTGAQIAGGVLATAPMVAAAPEVFGAGKGGLLARTLMSGGTGAVLGGADSAVRSGGDARATLTGAGVGGAFGSVAPALGQIAGRGANLLIQNLTNRFSPVPGMGNAAATMATEDFVNAGGRPAIDNRMGQLGSEAMLLDASPSHLGSAQGLAVRPETRQMITDPLKGRNVATNARLGTDLNSSLGPAQSADLAKQALINERKTVTGPMFRDAFDNAGPVDPSTVISAIDKQLETAEGVERAALLKTRNMLIEKQAVPATPAQRTEVKGPDGNVIRYDFTPADPGSPPVYKADAQRLHNIKGEIDSTIKYGDPQYNIPPSSLNRQQGAAKDVRGTLNETLRDQVPGYADANDVSRQFAKRVEAVDYGLGVLDGGKSAIHPDVNAQRLAAMSPEEQSAVRLGTRSDLDRIIGQNANDLVALKQAVKGEGDWNRAKLAQVFGNAEADRVMNSVDREAAFRDAYNKVVENSQTAMRTASANRFAVRGEGGSSGDGGLGLVMSGLAGGHAGVALAAGAKGAAKGASAAASLINAAEDVARNKQLAQALIMKSSPELDTVLNALGRRASLSGAGDKAGQVTDNLVRALLQSQGSRAGQEVERRFRR